VEADYRLSAREIGALLPRLLEKEPGPAKLPDSELKAQMELEIQIAEEDGE
jgi:hypothetical protein